MFVSIKKKKKKMKGLGMEGGEIFLNNTPKLLLYIVLRNNQLPHYN